MIIMNYLERIRVQISFVDFKTNDIQSFYIMVYSSIILCVKADINNSHSLSYQIFGHTIILVFDMALNLP